MISGIDDVCSVDVSTLPVSSQTSSPSDYVMSVSSRLVTLERRLKTLEHVSVVFVKVCDKYLYTAVTFDCNVCLSVTLSISLNNLVSTKGKLLCMSRSLLEIKTTNLIW